MAAAVIHPLLRLLAACAIATVVAGCAASPPARLTDLTSLQYRADSAYAKRDWHTALDAYKTLTQSVPDNAAYWFRLGNCYARLDQPNPAADAFRAALQRNPHIAPAWHNLGSVLLKQAQAAYRQAAAIAKPDDPLRQKSTLLAARIEAVRQGESISLPDGANKTTTPESPKSTPANPASPLTSKASAHTKPDGGA